MAASTLRWTRERSGSGPADTLDGRLELRRARIAGRRTRWVIVDRERLESLADEHRRVGHPGGYPTMRQAAEEAERILGYRR